MKKYNIIALFGESGAGKDTLLNYLCDESDFSPLLHKIVSYTTRPPRDYEKDGVDYHFVSPEKFAEMVGNGEMLEATAFRDWYYGTGLGSLDTESLKVNIGVFNIEGISILKGEPNVEVYPIRVMADDIVRLRRVVQRDSDADEIVRRYMTDKKDFSNIPFVYYTFPNNETDLNKLEDLFIEIADNYMNE